MTPEDLAAASADEAALLRQEIRLWRQRSRESERAREQVVLRLETVRRDLYDAHLRVEAAQAAAAAASAKTDVAWAGWEQAIRERDAILLSRSWLAVTAMRRVVARFPKLSRWGWRALRLGWWTITLQLVRRLKEWRRIREIVTTSPPPPPSAATEVPAIAAPPAQKPPEVAAVPPLRNELMADARLRGAARASLLTFMEGRDRLVFAPATAPDISVIIIGRGYADGLLRCLTALWGESGPWREIILVNAETGEETAELLSKVDGIGIVGVSGPGDLPAACNRAAAMARGDVLVFLDGDAALRPESLVAGAARLVARPGMGAVAGRVVQPSGRVWEAGGIIWSDGNLAAYGRGLDGEAGEAMFERTIDHASDTCLMTLKAVFDRLGGLDEGYATVSYGYADYAIGLRSLGYHVAYDPQMVLDLMVLDRRADEGETRRGDRNRFRLRHGEILSSRHLPPGSAAFAAAREHRNPGRRHLLMVDNEVPFGSLGSGYPRAREMLRVFADLGWSVTLFPLRRSDFAWATARLEIPWDIEIIDRSGTEALRALLAERRGHYDVILVSRPDNMELVREAVRDAPELLEGARLVYDAEAVFTKRELVRAELDGQPYSGEEAEAMLAAEAEQAAGVDAITCVTEAEASFFRHRQASPVHVISHFVLPRLETPGFGSREGFLFVGRLLEPTAPNWMGLKWFIDACWPVIRASLPDATLTVVGHLHPDHAELEAPGVRLVGSTADLDPFYDRARIFVAPIRFAAGVPIKILEAAAAGLPVAATRLMAEQLVWQPGTEIVADDDGRGLANACVRIHENAAEWGAMRAAALRQLDRLYSPRHFREGLEAVLAGRPPCLPDDAMRAAAGSHAD